MTCFQKNNIILFANGLRERILLETGGIIDLSELFHFFIGVDTLIKPWESKMNFKDKKINSSIFIEISSIDELKKFLSLNKVKYALLVGFIGADFRNHMKILQVLNRYNIKYGYFENRSDLNKIIQEPIIVKKNIIESLRKIYPKLLKKYYYYTIPPALHFFSSFEKSIGRMNESTKKISIPHREVYFAKKAPLVNEPSAFFIYLHQPIDLYIKSENVIQTIYETIKYSLNIIEVTYGLKAIICCHPNISQREFDFFSSHFKSVLFSTPSYMRNCDFFLAHTSISVNYAYIFQKKGALAIMDQDVYNENHRIFAMSKLHKLDVWKFGEKKVDIGHLVSPSNERIKPILETKNNLEKRYIDILREVILEE